MFDEGSTSINTVNQQDGKRRVKPCVQTLVNLPALATMPLPDSCTKLSAYGRPGLRDRGWTIRKSANEQSTLHVRMVCRCDRQSVSRTLREQTQVGRDTAPHS